jgi:hypothetical protein
VAPDSCWIFGGGVSNWGSALGGLPLAATALFLAENTTHLDSTLLVSQHTDGSWSQAGLSERPAQWALCNGRPSRSCLYLCEQCGVEQILSLLPLCTASPSIWHTVHVVIPHDLVGGVSARAVPAHFSWNSQLFAPLGPLPTLADLPSLVPRDISTILDSTVLM